MFIVLLGWGGSTRGQLAPYAQLHADSGARTHVFICDGLGSLVDFERVVADCRAAARDIADAAGGDEIVVHAFSDNGFIALCQILAAWQQAGVQERTIARIRAIVLDSAPGLQGADRAEFSRRFGLATAEIVARRLGVADHGWQRPLLVAALTRGFDLYQLGWSATADRLRGAYETVADVYPECPHLFLYGGADPITPSRDIEGFAAKLRARGVSVELREFADAGHVQCLRSEPDEYRRAIVELVERTSGSGVDAGQRRGA